jgi:hypothetical protein
MYDPLLAVMSSPSRKRNRSFFSSRLCSGVFFTIYQWAVLLLVDHRTIIRLGCPQRSALCLGFGSAQMNPSGQAREIELYETIVPLSTHGSKMK